MIFKVSSSLSSFKSLEFGAGLNILLAERHADSTARDTRNGTGKTSLIELIHYVLSEKRNANDDFHKPELVDSEFEVVFRKHPEEFCISKKSGAVKDEAKLNGEGVDVRELRQNLAQSWFGLTSEITSEKYSPKFGALFSYFVRKERNGGFATAIQNSSSQNPWDSQVCLSYLLGFDWHLPQKLQLKKDEKKDADALAKMIKSGYLTDGDFDINKMQTRLDILDSEIDKKRAEVSSSVVVDGYRSRERTANSLASQIRVLNETNIEDMELCENIDLALEEVEDANLTDVRTLYEQVGVFFADQVKHRFDKVEEFHKKVSQNRRTHLLREKSNAENRIQRRGDELNKLQRQLADTVDILKSGVAVERITLLQSELNTLETERAELQQQIPKFKNIDKEKKQLKKDIDELVDLIGQDVQEREEPRKFAVQTFASTSKFLYDESGELIIGKSKGVSGLSIETDIVGKKSGGKNHMQIFCFDWLLAEASKKQDRFPGFLVHDSHIFDGVDGRQIALALQFAEKKCAELGIQYIIAMNSDDLDKVEREFTDDGEEKFDPYQYVLDTRLTDETNGGLFGIRF